MEKPNFFQLTCAWLVHILTASGAFVGFLALLAYFQEDYKKGTLLIIFAVFIDAIDGFFARQARVKEVLPSFDGSLMDNLIDFNTYTLIPLVMLWRSQMIVGVWLYPVVALILLASLYQFCQGDAKTEDHFFLGFPSYWNILIIYLFWLGAPVSLNVATLLFFVFLSFVPIKFLYPSRSHYFRLWGMITSSAGGLIFLYIALFNWDTPPTLSLIAVPFLFFVYTVLSLIAHKRSLAQ